MQVGMKAILALTVGEKHIHRQPLDIGVVKLERQYQPNHLKHQII